VTEDLHTEVLKAIHHARQDNRPAVLVGLRKTLKQNPNSIRALLTLAGLTRDKQEAIAALERVLQLDPDNAMAHHGLTKLCGRKESQPRDHIASKPSTPAEHPRINGSDIVTMAQGIMWPFKDLNRPLGDLLETEEVTSRDLGWASWNAYDPIVKWAAAVCLKAEALEAINGSSIQARAVKWPFKGHNRPMGELLEEHVISLHDLAYAVANARDPEVRDAAAALGAQIVYPQVDTAPALPALEITSATSSLTDAADARPSDSQAGFDYAEETSVPGTAASPRPTDAPENGRLRVAKGSPYLRQQEHAKAKQKRVLAGIGIGLLALAVGSSLLGGVAALVGFTRHFRAWAGLSGVMLGVAWWLVPRVDRLRTEAQAFAKGRRGEERLVAFLRERLDGRWALFRNVVLPSSKGDIDAVLIGPHGLYALEVKAYSGYYRNQRKRWRKRFMGVWRSIDHNPTRQALRNAQRLHKYLAGQGVDVWVEPRVVWAGSGKVWLERPAARVWQFSRPAHMIKDLEEGAELSPEVVRKVVHGLAKAQRART
jgi:hypothetical protein